MLVVHLMVSSIMTATPAGGHGINPRSVDRWECDRSPLVVANVRLLDETDPRSILIADGRIEWIGPGGELPASGDGARRLDARGVTALPGLIDSHTHFDALPAAKHRQSEMDSRSEIFPITMRQTLASGVTATRVHLAALPDVPAMRTLSDEDCFPSPRMALSGPGILGGSPEVDAPLMRGVSGPIEASEAIATLARHGAQWVALHGISRFTALEAEAIRTAADDVGVRLLADTDSFEDLASALQWPVVSGEYLNRSRKASYPDDILSTLAHMPAEFFVTPPIGYYRRSFVYASGHRRIDPRVFLFVDDNLAAEMRRSFEEAFREDDYIAAAVASFETLRSKFHELRSAGATLVVGSDSGSLGQFHHDAVWQEMSAWSRFGVSPDEILAAATSSPARMLGWSDIGEIAVGARADLVLYSGAIGEGVFAREHVAAVVKGGIIFVWEHSWVGPNREQMLSEMNALLEGE